MRRHVWLCRLPWANVPAVFVFALAEGNSAGHALVEVGAIAIMHQARSAFTTDDDLVFAPPQTGKPRPIQGHARRRRAAAASLPRRAPHLRNADDCRGRAAPAPTGLDGPPRPQDGRGLRGLCA